MMTINVAWPHDGSGGQTVLDTSVPDGGASFRFTTPATLNPGAGMIGAVVHPDGANPCQFAGSFGVVGMTPLMTWGGGAVGIGTTVNFRGSPKSGGKKEHHDIILLPNTEYSYELMPVNTSGDHPVRVTMQKPKKEGH